MKNIYNKTIWINSKTPIDSQKLNKIESAIEDLYNKALGKSDLISGENIKTSLTSDGLIKIDVTIDKNSIEKVLTGDITSHNHDTQIKKILENYVIKQPGKDLSTNDFTNELKQKLEELTSGTNDYTILINKPKINNIELTGNKTLEELSIQKSELGKGLSTNDFTNEYKEKLENLSDNILNYNTISNKPKINNIELLGNKTLDELGLQEKGNYALKTEIPDISNKLDTSIYNSDKENFANKTDLINKVDVRDGYGLSQENYTSEEKEKLTNLNIEDKLSTGINSENNVVSQKTISKKFNELDTRIDSIIANDTKLIVVADPSLIFIGETKEIHITANLIGSNSILSISKDGQIIKTTETKTNTITITDTVKGMSGISATYNVSTEIYGKIISQDVEIIGISPVYIGPGNKYSEILKEECKLKTPLLSISGNYNIEITSPGQKIYFIIPGSIKFSTDNITMKGFYFPVTLIKEEIINEIPYKIYESVVIDEKLTLNININ